MEPPNDYFVKFGEGAYALNSKYEFEGMDEIGNAQSPEHDRIPNESRLKHTSDLKEAIQHWIDDFPATPFSMPSHQFFNEVNKIERHRLFSDLSNHLQQSGFDVWDRWKIYKRDVKILDRDKGTHRDKDTLLKLIKNDIYEIFEIKNLKFVWKENNLEDYECCLPMLIQERIFEREIGDSKAANAADEEEYNRISRELASVMNYHEFMRERLQKMPIIDKGSSIVWGETEDAVFERLECMRVLKQDRDALMDGKDEAISYLLEPPPRINDLARAIVDRAMELERDKTYIMEQLNNSLYCYEFAGRCKYLGENIKSNLL